MFFGRFHFLRKMFTGVCYREKESFSLCSIYSSFNCIMYDHATVVPEVCHTTTAVQPRSEWNEDASLWGQTCDGLDCILERVALPSLEVGDWLRFCNMGAYTSCAASHFNGFSLPDRFYCGTVDN